MANEIGWELIDWANWSARNQRSGPRPAICTSIAKWITPGPPQAWLQEDAAGPGVGGSRGCVT
ncbi:MAG: hypothetical protein D6753_06785 [Planctomycetota bacterium]|nr:MAG: hypothetical protein D6753_06785 [Planctomycetota bacterium]